VDVAPSLVVLLAIVVAVSGLAGRFALSGPLVLVVVGIAGSYLPFIPDVELTPELVLVGLLPPLLYAASIRTSLVDFRANRRPIALLSVGLVLFTVIGCNVAMEMDMPVLVIVVAGMISGCAGGVLRDILCNEIPLLFRSELYASVSVLTGFLYVIGLHFDLPHDPVMYTAMALGLAMRLLALRYNWQMPKFVYERDLH